MNIQNEIEQLEKQIAILKEKQKKELEVLNKFYSGDLYLSNDIKIFVKIFHLHSNIWGYIFNDGSGRVFQSKIEFVNHMNGNFTYVGKANNFSIKG